jgi:vacuolar-type H+-ATPase subunit E/Vma4
MSIESILEHIQNQGLIARDKLLDEARIKKQELLEQANKAAQNIYQEILDREKALYQNNKHKKLVNARLNAKKSILSIKQQIIQEVFNALGPELTKAKLKKKQIAQDKTYEVNAEIDFYLKELRLSYESEVAKILFG